MAAVPKYSNTCVNAEADAIGGALNTGYIRIYDGSQPANAIQAPASWRAVMDVNNDEPLLLSDLLELVA